MHQYGILLVFGAGGITVLYHIQNLIHTFDKESKIFVLVTGGINTDNDQNCGTFGYST